MPNITTEIDFLANDPIYETKKPYFIIPVKDGAISAGDPKVTNLKFDGRVVTVNDVREATQPPNIEVNGFTIAQHESRCLASHDEETVQAYKKETQQFLAKMFPGAEDVFTWDFRRRKHHSAEVNYTEFGFDDELHIEGPAKGAHDATLKSGPKIIQRHLPLEVREKYLKPGFRFRLVNTWRPLNTPTLEDNPLAFCDFSSLQLRDLVPCDRVYPVFIGEVFMLKYNPTQRWNWVSKQSPAEVTVMIMYDTHSNGKARLCPHVSVRNPLAEEGCPARESIETRSIVISRA